jgi:hypothetical protein
MIMASWTRALRKSRTDAGTDARWVSRRGPSTARHPKPVGYDPSIIPQWTSPQAPELGVLRLEPRALRVMPGTVMTKGEGALLTWRRP